MGERSTLRPRATIVVPAEVFQSLAMVTESLKTPVVLIGGRAVRCRLLMARSASRPTDDAPGAVRSRLAEVDRDPFGIFWG